MDNPLFDEGYKLLAKLGQARHAIHIVRDRELNRCGISSRKAIVLFIIQAIGDEATPAEIARWLFRQPHGVSALLNRMEKDGLVKKVKDSDSKTLVRVAITEKGQQAYRESANRDPVNQIMSSLSEEERRKLGSISLKLRDIALARLWIDTKPPYPPPPSAP
jgi:DNA-binding MarR family transcriptional regulator